MIDNYNLIKEKPKTKYLWKFIDINKFLSMLQNQDLHFSQLDNLNDIFEGANKINSLFIQLDYTNGFLPPFQRNKTMPENAFNEKQKSFKNRINALKNYQKDFYADCYFQGEEESVAMWDSYSLSSGVAIKFYSGLLLEEISDYYDNHLSKDYEFGFGSVLYENLSNPSYEEVLEGNPIDLIFEPFKKDLFHTHENEYRFIFHKISKLDIDHIKVKINLGKTIKSIVAHPNSPDWVIETIYKLVVKYELIKEVQKSRIITSEMASKIIK